MSYLDWVPWTTNTTLGGLNKHRFQKGSLKRALVVVDQVPLLQGARYVGLFRQASLEASSLANGIVSNGCRSNRRIIPAVNQEASQRLKI